MANTKISDLPGTTTLTDEDAIPVVQEGVTKKFTGVLTALKTLLGIGDPATLQTQSKQVVGAVNELNGKMIDGRISFKWEQNESDQLWYTDIYVDDTKTAAIPFGFNGKTYGLEKDIAEVGGKVVLNTTVPAPIASSGGSTVVLEWTHSEGDTSEYLYFIVDGTPVAKIRGMTRIG